MRTTASLLLALPVLLTASGTAFAHAHLRSAVPAADSTLTVPPAEVSIAFTEGVEPRFSSIAVTDANGKQMEAGPPYSAGDANHLAIGLKPIPPGSYTVTWHATSVDTHKTEGHYGFVLAAGAASGISIEKVWARPSAGAATASAAYFTISDAGTPDRLVGVSTPAAEKAELHESIDDHGVMKMRGVEGVALEPGKPVSFAPGGYHVMLTGLKQPLKQGDSFPLTLRFEHAAPLTVTVPVQTGMAGGSAAGHAMPMTPGQAPGKTN
jgi:copper(I)-binding protein